MENAQDDSLQVFQPPPDDTANGADNAAIVAIRQGGARAQAP